MKLTLRCVVLLLTSSCPFTLLGKLSQTTTPTTEQQALSVLNRLAYRPKPNDITRMSKMGLDRTLGLQSVTAVIQQRKLIVVMLRGAID